MIRRILVTPRSLSAGDHPALKRLEAAGFELVRPTPGAMPQEDDLIAALPGCVGWLAGVEPVTRRVIDAADGLRVVSRNGTGIDNLPIDALRARGVALRITPGANARGVAELALALALAGLRHLVRTHEGIRSGGWPRTIGREVAGARVAVVGLGAVGRETAGLFQALGAKVVAVEPNAEASTPANVTRLSLDPALDGADVVTLHCPPSDRPLLGAGQFAALAKGATVVNTARAGLVDEAALLSALDDGTVGCYATDVFATEPPEASDLTAHPSVVMVSHIGGFTGASVARAAAMAVDNLLEELGDGPS